MERAWDLVIRNGRVVDGSGGEPYAADVAIKDGLIAQVGEVRGAGVEEIEAGGKLVTPGFVDIHPTMTARPPGTATCSHPHGMG
jgi:N-acyl-D-amino-acid deacylase